jgi:hypothetical protein
MSLESEAAASGVGLLVPDLDPYASAHKFVGYRHIEGDWYLYLEDED